jgi:hypothetical protein
MATMKLRTRPLLETTAIPENLPIEPETPIGLSLSGLQAVPIFGHSFYGFPYCLDFRVKRHHWCQHKSARRPSHPAKELKGGLWS